MDLLALLLEIATKSTLVLALAALAVIALRRGSAAARHWIWTVGAAAVVALPALSVLLPAWPIPIFPETASWSYALGKVGPTDASNFAPWPVVSETPLTAESEPTPWHGAVLVLWSVGALAAGVRLATAGTPMTSCASARRTARRSTGSTPRK
jgi:hypothetical protein